MSDYAIGSAVRRSHTENTGSSRQRIVFILGTIAIVTVFVSLCIMFVVVPLLRVAKVEVIGARSVPERDIVTASRIGTAEYWFALDTSLISSNVLSDPRVKSAIVTRAFPDTVVISITERTAVAIVIVDLNGKTIPALIDGEGVVFAAAEIETMKSLPLLTGLRFENFRFGAKLPDNLVPTCASMESVRDSSPALLSTISEIRIVAKKHGEPEALLYTVNYRLPVRTCPVLNENLLRSIILVLDVVEAEGLAPSIEELDFRTSSVLYRIKEGVSG